MFRRLIGAMEMRELAVGPRRGHPGALMIRARTLPNALLPILASAFLALGPALTAHAQTPVTDPASAPRIGAKVRDSKGATVGVVERVIAGPDGRPRQVLVRVGRIARTLPVDGLAPSADAYVSVLSRAELEALPPSE